MKDKSVKEINAIIDSISTDEYLKLSLIHI